jgi:hypothetical protein
VLLDDMKRTLGAARICLPGGVEEHGSQHLIEPASASGVASLRIGGEQGMPDMSRLGLGEANRMLTSRYNGGGVSPRMEVQRLFNSQIAR